MAAKRVSQKCPNACTRCKSRKVRCSGETPCKNCINHGTECLYPPPQRRTRRFLPENSDMWEDRLVRVEAALKTSDLRHPVVAVETAVSEFQVPWTIDHAEPNFNQDHLSAPHTPTRVLQHSPNDHRLLDPNPMLLPDITSLSSDNLVSPLERLDETASARVDSDVQPLHSTAPNEGDNDIEQSILAPPVIVDGCHGSTSWMSICSKPAVAWVVARTNTPEFVRTAQELALGWTRRFKMGTDVNRARAPEPGAELAWRFCKAYFDHSFDAIFGILFRPAFETRLQQHFSSEIPDDLAWYAIRNVVYASGCRILSSQNPSSTFGDHHKESWKYFENAIAVHTELLITSTGLAAVQALTLMSYHVEGLGSPALLEYTFCSGASRLAQAQGLHRQPPRSWNLPASEVLHRNWLWWAVYCCEKHLARRSGRPSAKAIDDDDISCNIPTEKVTGSTMNVQYFDFLIKHWQISSRVSRLLCSAKALRTLPDRLAEVNAYLTKRLQEWYQDLPDYFKIKSSSVTNIVTSDVRHEHILHLHTSFHGSVMASHAIFTYPWVTQFLRGKNPSNFDAQESKSTIAVAEAARAIIRITRSIEVNPNIPHWIPFTYPMIAIINLFICILKNVQPNAIRSDLSLLDVAAGHYARMELDTAYQLSFSFGREVASIARGSVPSINEPLDRSTATLVDLAENNLDGLDWSLFEDVRPLGPSMKAFAELA